MGKTDHSSSKRENIHGKERSRDWKWETFTIEEIWKGLKEGKKGRNVWNTKQVLLTIKKKVTGQMRKTEKLTKSKLSISLAKLLITITSLLPVCRQAQGNAKMSLSTVADYLTCSSRKERQHTNTRWNNAFCVLEYIFMSAVPSTTSQESRKTTFLRTQQSSKTEPSCLLTENQCSRLTH